MTGAINCLIPQMRVYAANIFLDIDSRQASGALQVASLADLAIAPVSFAETMDLLEQVVKYNPTNVHDWFWVSFFLHLQISRFPTPNQVSNAGAIWDPAILQSLKTKNPPFLLTQLFALVTTAINDLRCVEYALCNYDENVSALIGAGIFIHALRHFERLLSQWTIFHLLEYMEPHLLSKDHLLFPKILIKAKVRPMTQPGGKPIFNHHIYSFLALFLSFVFLCLATSAWGLHPLRMAIIFSFWSHRSRYSFQPGSPFWTVLGSIPLLLPLPIAHWVLSEHSILQLVTVTFATGLFVMRVPRSSFVPASIKQTVIRFLIDRPLHEPYFIGYLCCIERPLATQLNMVLIYSILYDVLVSAVDPTGLSRARAYYCGDIPITAETHVHRLVQIQSSP